MLMVILHHVFAGYLEHTHRLGTRELPRDWPTIYSRSPLVPWILDLAVAVPLLFLISGFVLDLPFARSTFRRLPPPSLKGYLLRRLVRIEPPYVINLVVVFLFTVVHLQGPERRVHTLVDTQIFLPHLAAALAYLHAIIYATPSWLNGVVWTLEIEIQFYLLLPLLAFVHRLGGRRTRRLVLAALTLGWAWLAQHYVTPDQAPRLSLSIAGYLHYFLAGMLLTDLFLEPPAVPPRLVDLAGALSLASVVVITHSYPAFSWLLPVPLFLFCYAALRGRWLAQAFQHPVAAIAGGMSYTVYLYHFPLTYALLPVTVWLLPPTESLAWDALLQFGVHLIAIYAVCALLFPLLEKPFMLLSREVTRRYRHA